MKIAIAKLRWRLARRIAPRPIIASPRNGEPEGVWVMIFKAGAWSGVRADSFRGKFTNGVGRARFTGTVKSSTPLFDPETRFGTTPRNLVVETETAG